MSGETRASFRCFGGRAAVYLDGGDAGEDAGTAFDLARERLLAIHLALSRFLPDSELSRLNRAPQSTLSASPLMRMLVRAGISAARSSGGLVDFTQTTALEKAGYRDSMEGMASPALKAALRAVSEARRPASPDPAARWRTIRVDDLNGTVSRPPGVRLDSGGIGKGLAADLLAADLRRFPCFAVDCGGDIRIGGTDRRARVILVDDPFGGEPLHELELRDGAVATSGIGRRAWLGPGGAPAHHLLDPATGAPAFTGVVQATALAKTAQTAEGLAKTALLRGPEKAAGVLRHGGCVVFEDGSLEVVAEAIPAAVIAAPPAPRRTAA